MTDNRNRQGENRGFVPPITNTEMELSEELCAKIFPDDRHSGAHTDRFSALKQISGENMRNSTNIEE